METTTRQVRFIRTITAPDGTVYEAGIVYDLPPELALHFVASENAAEWHTPRRYVPSNGGFLSSFDPVHLRA